jgi:hypothetical protein
MDFGVSFGDTVVSYKTLSKLYIFYHPPNYASGLTGNIVDFSTWSSLALCQYLNILP